MTTATPAPSPELVAAAPTLIAALTDLQNCVNTILTGDPAQIGLRAGPAVQILIGQLTLLMPALAVAEEGVVQQDINTKLGGLITQLKGIQTAVVTPSS